MDRPSGATRGDVCFYPAKEKGPALAIRCRFGVGSLWVCCAFAVGSLWVRCRFAVGSLWVRGGFDVGSLWVVFAWIDRPSSG